MGMLRPIRRILVGRSQLEIGSLVLGGRHGGNTWRVEDGRFVEQWDQLNTFDIFIQVARAVP